ncbi:UNVERIFIED_CONTAM: hypothetical protein RKD43_000529 [Streptomyces graminofaciens]
MPHAGEGAVLAGGVLDVTLEPLSWNVIRLAAGA